MIAKSTRGASPHAIGRYLHGPGNANEHVRSDGMPGGEVLDSNFAVRAHVHHEQWARAMQNDIARRANVKSPVYQVSLRLAPEDAPLTQGQWCDAARIWLDTQEVPDTHKWVIVQHGEDHIHLVVSRVGVDGSLWHARNDYRKNEIACRKIERVYELRKVRNSFEQVQNQEVSRAVSRGEIAARQRGASLWKDTVAVRVDALHREITPGMGGVEYMELGRKHGLIVTPNKAGDKWLYANAETPHYKISADRLDAAYRGIDKTQTRGGEASKETDKEMARNDTRIKELTEDINALTHRETQLEETITRLEKQLPDLQRQENEIMNQARTEVEADLTKLKELSREASIDAPGNTEYMRGNRQERKQLIRRATLARTELAEYKEKLITKYGSEPHGDKREWVTNQARQVSAEARAARLGVERPLLEARKEIETVRTDLGNRSYALGLEVDPATPREVIKMVRAAEVIEKGPLKEARARLVEAEKKATPDWPTKRILAAKDVQAMSQEVAAMRDPDLHAALKPVPNIERVKDKGIALVGRNVDLSKLKETVERANQGITRARQMGVRGLGRVSRQLGGLSMQATRMVGQQIVSRVMDGPGR